MGEKRHLRITWEISLDNQPFFSSVVLSHLMLFETFLTDEHLSSYWNDNNAGLDLNVSSGVSTDLQNTIQRDSELGASGEEVHQQNLQNTIQRDSELGASGGEVRTRGNRHHQVK